MTLRKRKRPEDGAKRTRTNVEIRTEYLSWEWLGEERWKGLDMACVRETKHP